MNTCKATMRVLVAHRLYLIIYLVLIGIMMFAISGAQLLGGIRDTADTYEPGRANVAVIDRDGDRGHVADAMRAYLSADSDLVDLADEPETLQQAVASNWVDLIVIIPDGYADGLIASAASGTAAPAVETVTSYTSGAGSLASMNVGGFLSMTRTALIGGNVTVDADDWAAKYGDGANGAGGAGWSGAEGAEGDVAPHGATSFQGTVDMLPEGTLGHLTMDDLADAADRARDTARNQDANHAVGVDHADADATKADAIDATAGAFGGTMKTALYPLFLAMTVCTALVLGVFNAGETRRRLFASPQRASVMGIQRIATIGVFALAVAAVYLLGALGLLLAAGLDPTRLSPGGVAMTAASVCVYALMTVGCGFLIGECGLSETMANGFANLFGLLIMFTSGISFPPDMMPAPMLAIGHMLPGWWYCVAIDDAFGIGTASDGGVDVAGWAVSTGLVALFGVAFVCMGLAAGRLRRTRPVSASTTAAQLAEA